TGARAAYTLQPWNEGRGVAPGTQTWPDAKIRAGASGLLRRDRAACRSSSPRGRLSVSSDERTMRAYSHSIVDGGFDEMSSATRLTAGISFMIRLEIVSRSS